MKKVFISSTCYDLADVRAEIPAALDAWGYKPVNNESQDFPKKTDLHSHDVCLEAVKECDYYLLIIDKRFGGVYAGDKLENPDEKSITWCEAETAYEAGLPVFTFVRKNIWEEKNFYKNNRKKKPKLTHAENAQVFDFIDAIVHKDKNNWIEQFENSVEIKAKLKLWLEQATPANQSSSSTLKDKIRYITEPAPNFTGREDYLAEITEWYNSKSIKIGCLEGFGGMGKSSIAREWYDKRAENSIAPDGIFWWGFYKDRSLDNFLDQLLEFASGKKPDEDIKGSFRKMELALEQLSEREVLIVLDGFEEMQQGAERGDNFGKSIHRELAELLHGFCDSPMRGLCLVTTRFPLSDVKSWLGKNFTDKKMEGLHTEDSVKLLKEFGVRGDEPALEKLAIDFDGHAISITLVATHLVTYYEGDIKRAGEIPSLATDAEAGGKAHKILKWYDSKLSVEERLFMQIFSLLRRELYEKDFPLFTTDHSFNTELAGLSDFSLRKLIDGLVKRRLLIHAKGGGFDTHPLVREYFKESFATEIKRDCHEVIYRHLEKTAPEKPETLEAMVPLFDMLHHGCAAGLYQEVLIEVYHKRIMRGNASFLVFNLGAHETRLNLLCNFFSDGELTGSPLTAEQDAKAYILNNTAFSLLSIGRPVEAVSIFKKTIELDVKDENWINANIDYRNLSHLYSIVGEMSIAIDNALKSIELLEKLEGEMEIYSRLLTKSTLAWCYFLAGKIKKSTKLFNEVETLMIEVFSGLLLYSYGKYLLKTGKASKARDQVEQSLKVYKKNGWPEDISRIQTILADIERVEKNYVKSEKLLSEVLVIALKIGVPQLEIEALLVRGRLFIDTANWQSALKDAERVLTLVERTNFYLFEPDALTLRARAYLLKGDRSAAKKDATTAQKKAEGMGYAIARDEAAQFLEEL